MAERRMFAKTIIDSDAFLDMPLSAQALYFHLSMRADDDGFVNNPKKIQRMIGASDDDCRLLVSKRFVLTFESGVIVIKHWRIHNYIRNDRYKETVYTKEKSVLKLDKNNAYTETNTDGIPTVYQMETQVRIGKDSLKEKENIIKEKERKIDDVINELPERLHEPLREFVKMRKAIKKPVTTHGLDLLVDKLRKLSDGSANRAVLIVNKSIANSWQGFFELKAEDEELLDSETNHNDCPYCHGTGVILERDENGEEVARTCKCQMRNGVIL